MKVSECCWTSLTQIRFGVENLWLSALDSSGAFNTIGYSCQMWWTYQETSPPAVPWKSAKFTALFNA
jgi:hypothetical protein